MTDRFNFSQSTLFTLGLVAIVVYIFLLFRPEVYGVTVGLDPSWTYAISKAVEDRLVFGRDIIFTYGPFGYLTQGAALESNVSLLFLFRSIVHFAFLGVVITRLVTLKRFVSKLIFTSSIFLIFVWGTLYGGTIGITIDYEVYLAFIITLSFQNFIIRNLRNFSIILGVIMGFSILSKLTLGVYIAGCFYLFVLGNLFDSYRTRSNLYLGQYLRSLCDFTLLAFSVATIFLSLESSRAIFVKLFFNFLISLAIYLALSKILPKTKLHSSLIELLPYLVAYLFYTLLFLQTISQEAFPSLLDYLQNSGQLSSAYSSAMSYLGSRLGLWLAFLCLVLILPLLYLLVVQRSLGLTLAFLFSLFLSFKHGFVRQDGHVIIFTIVMIVIASLSVIKIENNQGKVKNIPVVKLSHVIYLLIFLLCIAIAQNSVVYPSRIQQFSPQRALQNVVFYAGFANWPKFTEQRQQSVEAIIKETSGAMKLPDSVQEKVKGKTIDIIPWEFSIVPANDLDWKPRPVIQSYAAYTEKLDDINDNNLADFPRDFIFYQFRTIDGRHPFFDEPKTFSRVICNYRPDSIPDAFSIHKRLAPYYLLDRQNTSRCTDSGMGETTQITWNTPYELPTRANSITRAKIEFQYSLLGKIVKTLFRIPPVYMNVNYLDGTNARFRIIQENSANGPIVSHLPRNEPEIAAFLQGNLSPQVKSIQFEVSDPWLFHREIAITPFWKTYR
jgi:hypothetical protein